MSRHKQLIGNAGLYHVARELSRRGWLVMPTARNSRGADLYAASADETLVLSIQSKASEKRENIRFGRPETLMSSWWIVTINALSDRPMCLVLTLDEVRARARPSATNHYLVPSDYDRAEHREAWHRLGDPGPPRETDAADSSVATV